MNTLTLCSPAKLNLFLRVLRKRQDGFHDIASLFQSIDLCDSLTFNIAEQDKLTCDDPSIPTDRSNLVWKAVDLFRKKTNLNTPFHIDIAKKIPAQAGLGGGSSNAATTLWAINELLGKPATTTELMEWSKEIGSDITFFFSTGTAYCTGRGEKISPLPPLPPKQLLIVKPPQGLSTPAVYQNFSIDKASKISPEDLLRQCISGKESYINDLEQPAFKLMPDLLQLKERLSSLGFDTVTMTGSGTSFFCSGQGSLPLGNNLQTFSSCFLQRDENDWYHIMKK